MVTKYDAIAFLRAAGIGALIGGGPYLLLTIPLGLGAVAYGEISGLLFTVFPLAIAFAITLAAMLVIGLPTTAALSAANRECPRIYATVGAVCGFVIPALTMLLSGPITWDAGGTYLLPLGGMVAGAMAAFSWGKYRKSLRQDAEPPVDTTNPIHDLLF